MSKFGEQATKRLEDVRQHANGSHPDGYREGAALLYEAGQAWQAVVQLCTDRLSGRLMDANNIEDLFAFVEALRDRGAEDLMLGNERYSLDYISTMLRLWIWAVYQYCPIASQRDSELWEQRREPYVALATRLQQDQLSEHVTVLTTNYDLIFESLLLCETTSLRPDAGHSIGFGTKVDQDDVSIVHERFPIPICKLHGSVDLFTIDSPPGSVLEGGRDGRWLPIVPRDYRPRFLQADRLDKTRHNTGRLAVLQRNSLLKLRRRHGESLTPAIAPPSFYKAGRYDWLVHTWHEASRVLNNATDIIFIGYSMPASDGHLLGMLATSLALRERPPVIRVLDSSQLVIERFQKAFGIIDEGHVHCAKFESASAIATLTRWLDEASSRGAFATGK